MATPAPSPESPPSNTSAPPAGEPPETVLCRHCGRTASNGISCEGHCVADSDY